MTGDKESDFVATRRFQFADEFLQDRLLQLLKKSKLPHSIDSEGVLCYSSEEIESIENDIICSIRDELFEEWSIFTLEGDDIPRPDETERYRRYMLDHSIPHHEERHDGLIWFLISGDQDSHEWNVLPN